MKIIVEFSVHIYKSATHEEIKDWLLARINNVPLGIVNNPLKDIPMNTENLDFECESKYKEKG